MRTNRNELARCVDSEVAFLTILKNPRTRSAFTLIELMVVIVIIGILASSSLYVVGHVQHLSRVHTTEVRIARLDHVISELYESYTYRRMPVPGSIRNPRTAAVTRYRMICDTMRMEMPNTWLEALTGPQVANLPDSPRRLIYEKAFINAVGTFDFDDDGYIVPDDPNVDMDAIRKNQEAKLLYLIVMNAIPEARDMVGEKGIATDGTGFYYFTDAWGNPIHFLRWAPGFSGGDRQPDLWKWTGSTPDNTTYPSDFTPDAKDDPNVVYWDQNLSPDIFTDEEMALDYEFPPEDWQKKNVFDAIKKYPDPLDPARARPSGSGTQAQLARPGFFLVPLIFSAGPDGQTGIKGLKKSTEIVIDPFARGIGAPEKDYGYHYDNIHNHTLGGR